MYGAKRIKDSTVQNYFSTQLQVSPRTGGLQNSAEVEACSKWTCTSGRGGKGIHALYA